MTKVSVIGAGNVGATCAEYIALTRDNRYQKMLNDLTIKTKPRPALTVTV